MKILSIVKITFCILLLFVSVANSRETERPNKKYSNQAIEHYKWIVTYKDIKLSIYTNDTASKFISKESLQRYLKLKMRNFVKDYNFVEKPTGFNHNYMYLAVELFRYNSQTKIHYGLISLRAESAINNNSGRPQVYKLTESIAGNEEQLNKTIKGQIDIMVEILAEDYYLIEDLTKK